MSFLSPPGACSRARRRLPDLQTLGNLLLAAALCLALPKATLSQETTGAIVGLVLDPNGVGIPGAIVVVEGSTFVRPQETRTSSTGAYQFLGLPPGVYSVTAVARGFILLKETGLNLEIGKTLTKNMRMEIGPVTESITISTESVVIDTVSSSVLQNVRSEFFNSLPRARNFDSLVVLAPGVRAEPKSGQYQVDGASGSENSWILEGVERADIQKGTLTKNSQIPFEFVKEFQIKSSGYEAQFPAATGGVFNVVTRGGGNQFHGQVSLYANTGGMNAAPRPSLIQDPLDDRRALYVANPKEPRRVLNPGALISGPLVKFKLWYFAGWYPEFTRTERTVNFLQPVVTRSYESRGRQDYLLGKLDYAPSSRLRTSVSYLYSPYRVNGLLPSYAGNDNPDSPWAQRGSRSPAASYTWSANYTVSPRLVISYHGGYVYTNLKDYGIPRGTYFRYLTSSLGLDGVPPALQAPAGNFTANNYQKAFDKQKRANHYADLSCLANAWGQHDLRAGYSTNRLGNEVSETTPDGHFRVGWNRAYNGIVTPGQVQGKFGYYIYRSLGTFGDVGSDNTGLYLQDNWRVAPRLTLNLGLRADREFVPSFQTGENLPSRVVEWGLGQKLAPRLGFALDLTGSGAWTLKANWGRNFDQFKYSLPRSSFGGDVWKDYVYPLDDPDITRLSPANTPGRLFEVVDWRIPANDPRDNRVDPGLAPARKHFFNLLTEYSLTPNTVAAVRYARSRLDRAIEDVGVLTPLGEAYYIANPGFGVTADRSRFEAGIPTSPQAVTNYDALEFRLDKHIGRNLMYSLSYTYGRLWGNYSGLASSDEEGRTDPNISRAFDLPWEKYNAAGQPVYGLLPTDRPHTFKAFGAYSLPSRFGTTTVSPTLLLFSGTPLSTELAVVSVPMLANGRGDLGRTPRYNEASLGLFHEFKVRPGQERYRVRLEANITNLFNNNTVLNRATAYLNPIDGGLRFQNVSDIFEGFDYQALAQAQQRRLSPLYGLPNSYQGPRMIRLGLHFSF